MGTLKGDSKERIQNGMLSFLLTLSQILSAVVQFPLDLRRQRLELLVQRQLGDDLQAYPSPSVVTCVECIPCFVGFVS